MARSGKVIVRRKARRNLAFASMSAAQWSQLKRREALAAKIAASQAREFERVIYRPLTRATRKCGVVVAA